MKDEMNETTPPKISVVIPTCHRNDLLALCLDRLAPGTQTLPAEQYEVIVTDDGSRSTAQELVQEKYPWAIWTAGPRRGPAANRNHGAALAQNEWLAFTDDDCLPAPGWLEAFSAAIEPDVLVYEGKTTCEAGLHSPLQHAPINLTGGWLWSCNMMIHSVIFREMEGFDSSFPHPHMEDTDFRERLKHDSHAFVFVTASLVDHPPRKTAWGRRMGATHESGVLFWYKHGHSKPFYRRLFTDIIKSRLATIRRSNFCPDTFSALASMCIELGYVAVKISAWENKYRSYYQHYPPLTGLD